MGLFDYQPIDVFTDVIFIEGEKSKVALYKREDARFTTGTLWIVTNENMMIHSKADEDQARQLYKFEQHVWELAKKFDKLYDTTSCFFRYETGYSRNLYVIDSREVGEVATEPHCVGLYILGSAYSDEGIVFGVEHNGIYEKVTYVKGIVEWEKLIMKKLKSLPTLRN